MNKHYVKALLDRPSARSLGMLGLAVDFGDQVLRTEGVAGGQAGTLTVEELGELISAGHALKIDGPEFQTGGYSQGALWIGDQFASDADKYDLALPPLPEQASGKSATGRYWIAPITQISQVIDSWLVRAFREVVHNPSEELAKLMSWALPEREETRAALWLTARDERLRSREVNWWVRLAKDHGQSNVTTQSFTSRLEEIIGHAKGALLPKVVGLCAPAKGGDNAIADFIATQRQIRRVSFGLWLRTHAPQGGSPSNRVVLQKLGQEMIDRHGALFFCLKVLQTAPSVSLNQAFVIDGIRHLDVFKSIQFLVGPDRFAFAFVDRPRAQRRKLLIEDENLTPDIADQVLNDRTEDEIPQLKSCAELTLDGDGGAEREGRKLLQALAV